MELKLRPADKNLFPLGAVLIRGASAAHWLEELQRMNLSLQAVAVYPLPGTAANTVWGCLAVCNAENMPVDVGRNGYCQRLHNRLFIPERAALYPLLSAGETAKLFGDTLHFFHPGIGLVELAEPLDWATALVLPEAKEREVKKPAATPFVPQKVKTFLVKPMAAEELLQNFEETHFPERQKFTDKPLNPFEKAKLALYRRLFTKTKNVEGNETGVEKTSLLSKLDPLLRSFFKKESDWAGRLQQEYEELERRNRKHLDRLLELLKNNPEEALKYAIPLDAEGTNRGGLNAAFTMQKRWFDFSLFGTGGGGGSGSVSFADDTYDRLRRQYTATAQALVKEGNYRKAAFVYMKLLKNYGMAADALEKGSLYAEAAAVYLKYCNNKPKAAECYEKGKMIEAAIDLHKELGNDEKAGDLYLSVHKKKEAFFHYQKVADGYTQNHQYLKAALLYKAKMENETAAQQTLLTGWRLSRDGFHCLNNYFASIRDEKALGEAIQAVYRRDVNTQNRETFLRVLQYEYAKGNGLAQTIKDDAYEIIADVVKTNPAIVSELKGFNKDDKQLVKDTLRFKVAARKG